MPIITMNAELTQAYNEAIAAVRELDRTISRLRALKVSTSIREHDGKYFLDARAALGLGFQFN